MRVAIHARAGIAVASAISSGSRLRELSLPFTGVADGTCEALAQALGARGCALQRVDLTGNRLTRAGVSALASSLGSLRSLDLGANVLMDGAAACALAKAMPGSALRTLRLAGCGVDKQACKRFAAALLHASLTSLDLSANHFGSDGSDELAWVLPQAEALRCLDLSDCVRTPPAPHPYPTPRAAPLTRIYRPCDLEGPTVLCPHGVGRCAGPKRRGGGRAE